MRLTVPLLSLGVLALAATFVAAQTAPRHVAASCNTVFVDASESERDLATLFLVSAPEAFDVDRAHGEPLFTYAVTNALQPHSVSLVSLSDVTACTREHKDLI